MDVRSKDACTIDVGRTRQLRLPDQGATGREHAVSLGEVNGGTWVPAPAVLNRVPFPE